MNTLIGTVITPPSNNFLSADGMLNTTFELKTTNNNISEVIVKVTCHGRYLVQQARKFAMLNQELIVTGEITGDFYEDASGRVFESLYIDADNLIAN